MQFRADLPKFRALNLNYRSVSVTGGTHLVAIGGSQAVIHEDTEARGERDGLFGAKAGLVFSGEGWSSGSVEGRGESAGGGPRA